MYKINNLIHEFLPNTHYDVKEIKAKFSIANTQHDDKYSDGDIENEILKKVLENTGEEKLDQIAREEDWVTYYHLSDIRKNIIRWYPFEANSSVLEIGGGMGAVTSALCEKGLNITSVELSTRRGLISLIRNKVYDNLKIVIGNFSDIRSDEKYDYVLLIGVLEYQGIYTKYKNPYVKFMQQIKEILKPNGKAIIAIENKYGLKYWCGASEDHTGINFDGINNYKVSESKIRTFTKKNLENVLSAAGFTECRFYYPYPDYKFPMSIFSDSYRLKDADQIKFLTSEYGNKWYQVADARMVLDELLENDISEVFSNSFLVECSNDQSCRNYIDFVTFSNERKPEYRILTYHKDKTFIKEPFGVIATKHWDSIYRNLNELAEQGCRIIEMEQTDNKLLFKEMKFRTVSSLIEAFIENEDKKSVKKLLNEVYKDIIKSSTLITNKCEKVFNDQFMISEDLGVILENGYLDMVPQNCFFYEDGLIWFDQEWKFNKVPVLYIIYRGIDVLYKKKPWLDAYIPREYLFEAFEIYDDRKNIFEIIEEYFTVNVVGYQNKYLTTKNNSDIKRNILALDSSIDVIDSIINFCSKCKKIYIYGAGRHGKKLKRIFTKLNIKIDGYIVSDGHKKDDKIGTVNIYELSSIPETILFNEETGIAIAIEDQFIRRELSDKLYKLGVKKIHAF